MRERQQVRIRIGRPIPLNRICKWSNRTKIRRQKGKKLKSSKSKVVGGREQRSYVEGLREKDPRTVQKLAMRQVTGLGVPLSVSQWKRSIERDD